MHFSMADNPILKKEYFNIEYSVAQRFLLWLHLMPCLLLLCNRPKYLINKFIQGMCLQSVVHSSTMGICSEKCKMAILSLYEHCRMLFQKSRWYSLLRTLVLWYSLLLPGYKPRQHVTVQSNTEKVMQSRDVEKHGCMRLLATGITQHCVLQ